MAELSRSSARPASPADPRAVRVRLAAESQTGDEPAIRVAPEAGPLRMTNPTVGTGPLGGLVIEPDAADEPVSAQRQVMVDGEPADASLRALGGGRYLLEGGGAARVVLGEVSSAGGGVRRREVIVDGFRFLVDLESERIAALRERASQGRASSAHAGPLQVKAIIPGKVVAVSVAAGDAVTAGQQLLVVEAMKMQNELRAPRDGTIERVGVAVGVNIEIGDLLVVIS
jgi:hypothetical protein